MFMDVFKRWTAGLTTDSLEVDERPNRMTSLRIGSRFTGHRTRYCTRGTLGDVVGFSQPDRERQDVMADDKPDDRRRDQNCEVVHRY
jgi:hypothetical protein